MNQPRHYFPKGHEKASGVANHYLVSSVRVFETPAHWHIHVWNRGGKSGELAVKAEDGPRFLDMLLPPAIRVEDKGEEN